MIGIWILGIMAIALGLFGVLVPLCLLIYDAVKNGYED